MNKNKALIVLSGGMDSVTMLWDIAISNQYDEIEGISFDYGSKHNQIELPLAKKNCDMLKIKHQIIKLDFINQLFRSNLLQSGGDIPEGHYTQDNMSQTVVPNRNMILASIAAGYGDSYGFKHLFMGIHSGDHAIYKDCRPEFRQSLNKTIELATENEIQVKSPYLNENKITIMKIGLILGIDYRNNTWTCYNPHLISKLDHKYIHCGKCGACVERIEAEIKNNIFGTEQGTIYSDMEFAKKQLGLN